MSIRQFINTGLSFCHDLSLHHNFEEQHIFPFFATRMPAFRKELLLLTQHKEIHKGLDKLEAYLERCQRGETDMRLDELKVIMDSFGKVLWAHLAEEVQELEAENMRKYWSLEDMKRMPM
jgi:hemerythrin-like domain-containing protein